MFNPLTPNQQSEITSEFDILLTMARRHAQENPGATMQMDQGRRQESESTDIQSQVQERETSQSVSTLGDTTQTQERSRDRMPRKYKYT